MIEKEPKTTTEFQNDNRYSFDYLLNDEKKLNEIMHPVGSILISKKPPDLDGEWIEIAKTWKRIK
ncbi:MAG: hypothetical protein JJE03_07115 [Peptostreptococcaceae bacterium]|nr:hypothetical protein [Peptostreptococcaceae bacterium]